MQYVTSPKQLCTARPSFGYSMKLVCKNQYNVIIVMCKFIPSIPFRLHFAAAAALKSNGGKRGSWRVTSMSALFHVALSNQLPKLMNVDELPRMEYADSTTMLKSDDTIKHRCIIESAAPRCGTEIIRPRRQILQRCPPISCVSHWITFRFLRSCMKYAMCQIPGQ